MPGPGDAWCARSGGEPVLCRAGDSFVMKPGFVGVWRTVETVRTAGRRSGSDGSRRSPGPAQVPQDKEKGEQHASGR
ncbi:cupin domain-containing protein [Streptomyces sp. AK04-3B]|uniref:cupin domain-containing protein n=1 Tax=unclassified Streptomyces TaxID=2593676 RepID=UPI0039F577BF